jgi:hypothetical protein
MHIGIQESCTRIVESLTCDRLREGVGRHFFGALVLEANLVGVDELFDELAPHEEVTRPSGPAVCIVGNGYGGGVVLIHRGRWLGQSQVFE